MASSERREPYPFKEPTRLALEYALGLLEDTSKAAVLDLLKKRGSLSLNNDVGEVSREQVEQSLREFFGQGTNLFLRRFDEYLQKQHTDVAAN
jgi:hypothetical protein